MKHLTLLIARYLEAEKRTIVGNLIAYWGIVNRWPQELLRRLLLLAE